MKDEDCAQFSKISERLTRLPTVQKSQTCPSGSVEHNSTALTQQAWNFWRQASWFCIHAAQMVCMFLLKLMDSECIRVRMHRPSVCCSSRSSDTFQEHWALCAYTCIAQGCISVRKTMYRKRFWVSKWGNEFYWKSEAEKSSPRLHRSHHTNTQFLTQLIPKVSMDLIFPPYIRPFPHYSYASCPATAWL